MIHVLHQFNYWTEYVEGIFEDKRFNVVRLKNADTSYPNAEVYEPRKYCYQNLLLTCRYGSLSVSAENAIMRSQHSPGMSLNTLVVHYDWCRKNNVRIMVPSNRWEYLVNGKSMRSGLEDVRADIIKNKNDLLFTDYDPIMNRIYRAERVQPRIGGTALVMPNWRVRKTAGNIARFIEVLEALRRYGLVISVVFHPLTTQGDEHPNAYSGLHSKHLMSAMTEHNFAWEMGLTRDRLVHAYDRHEFIVSDGSGSLYEAVARGCKALFFDGMCYQQRKGTFQDPLENGCMPRTHFTEVKHHLGFEMDWLWLQKFHGKSLVKEDVSPLVAAELLSAFKEYPCEFKPSSNLVP